MAQSVIWINRRVAIEYCPKGMTSKQLFWPLWVILRTDVALIGCGELEGEQRDSQNDEQSEGSVRCLEGGSRLTMESRVPSPYCLLLPTLLVPLFFDTTSL